jgi:hypothetical protein
LQKIYPLDNLPIFKTKKRKDYDLQALISPWTVCSKKTVLFSGDIKLYKGKN